ncbi:MFS transporter [Dictyobacter arantiisoli]|uniref:MFS transporter n=2 Tax=Dictyobacter arantiisoli TaxID=2014874 RepID=A0A5A5TJE3_9CHLR|nr:MFS transporter [Dictyobacter arantiisoli]
MPSVSNDPNSSVESVQDQQKSSSRKRPWSLFQLPRNVYLLLTFTLGKGFQLSIANLTLNYYVHSLGFKPDFIGIFTAMSAIGAMIAAVPVGLLADRWGRKPVLLLTAFLSPLFLALIALATSAPWLLILSFIQGLVSTAYWVSNLPLLSESTTEEQRVGVLAMNSFLLLGIGSLGNLLGGFIPELAGSLLHVSAASALALRWGVFTASLFTFVFGLPLWFLQSAPKSSFSVAGAAGVMDLEANDKIVGEAVGGTASNHQQPIPLLLFGKLLLPDLLFTMGEGAVVALIQVYFVLRFHLLPGPLGVIFTVSGVVGGLFALSAPLFVNRWGKLRIITLVQYISAPLMVLIGIAPVLPLAVAGEYTRSFLRTLIEPVYAAFEMEQVTPKLRGTLAGCYSVTWSLGFSFGPAIAGWLQTNVNLTMSFIFGACCLLIAPSLLLLFFGKKSSLQNA